MTTSITVTTAARSEMFLGHDLTVKAYGDSLLFVRNNRRILGAFLWPWTVSYVVFEGDEHAPLY